MLTKEDALAGSDSSKHCPVDSRVLYVDCWGGDSDEDLCELENKEVNVKVFLKGSTGMIQSLALYCFPQWKDFAKRFSEYATFCNTRVDDRNSVLKLQSLIFNQLQHSSFRLLWLCGWRLARSDVPNIPFQSLADLLIKRDDDCKKRTALFQRCPSLKVYIAQSVFVRIFSSSIIIFMPNKTSNL